MSDQIQKTTLPKLIAEVKRLGTEYPNARYVDPEPAKRRGGPWNPNTRCFYTLGMTVDGPPDSCGCIFGQAVRNLVPGVEPLLVACEGAAADDLARLVCEDYDQWARWDRPSPGRLVAVQNIQDNGLTWKVAITYLEELT